MRRRAGGAGIGGRGRCSRQVSRRRAGVYGSFAYVRPGGQGQMEKDDRRAGWGIPGPLIFGVIAATIELAIILVVLYCD